MHTENRLHLSLPAATTTPRHARRETAMFLRAHDVHDMDVALLVVSELVTNAVVHAGGGELALELDHDSMRIAVTDNSPVAHAARPPDLLGHRGIPIIDALATSWGTTTFTGGKTVWCTIAVPRGHADGDGDGDGDGGRSVDREV